MMRQTMGRSALMIALIALLAGILALSAALGRSRTESRAFAGAQYVYAQGEERE